MNSGAAQGEGLTAGGSNPPRSTIKQLRVRLIPGSHARAFIKSNHYSGKVVNNSQINFGVFLRNRLCGALQFGPPMIRRNALRLVEGTAWNGMLELNRMAFVDDLPRNSESRCIGIALRMLRREYPQLEWVLSYADATQCGDGTIYRASNFVLTDIKENWSVIRMPDGSISSYITHGKANNAVARGGKTTIPEGAEPLSGFQLRYIYFYSAEARARLTVPEVPFSEIAARGAGMYKGHAR